MSNLVLTGVIDGPLADGLPRAIQLYVREDIADLSTYGLGSANNGNGSVGAEFTFPAQPASKDSYLYVSTESTGFASYFGFAPDFVSSSAASINGDDAIELFQNGVLVDVFGDVNVDGTGRPIPFRRRALPSRRHWSSTRCWVRPLAPIPSSSNWWAGQASRWRDTA